MSPLGDPFRDTLYKLLQSCDTSQNMEITVPEEIKVTYIFADRDLVSKL